MNKMLRQAIVKRSRLKSKANKTKNHLDIRNYKKQRKITVNLNKEAKLQYFNNYDSTNTKPLWENCKPYFSNKHSKADTDIILSENGDLILKNDKIANTFNDYSESIVENMNLYHWEDKPFSTSDIIKNITQKYKDHPSIRSLKRNCKGISYFSVQPFSVDEVIKVVKNFQDSKAVGGDILTKIRKECEFTFDIINARVNKAIETGNFRDSLKMANVTPVF